MSYLRFRDDDDSSLSGTVTSVLIGVAAGIAVGMFIAQRTGGFSGIADAVRRRVHFADDEAPGGRATAGDDFDDLDEYEEDEIEDETGEGALEERVLEAFRNDPVLSERAIDIGGIGESTIELSGWVDTDEEVEHAMVLARGVPGVATVLSRLTVGDEEERIRDHTRRHARGDDALTEARWEGRTIGTGRRRQGTSDEIDRHADPRVELRERWTRPDAELEQAAEDIPLTPERAPRERKGGRGERTGGASAPAAPSSSERVVEPPTGG